MKKVLGILFFCLILMGCSPVKLPNVATYKLSGTKMVFTATHHKTNDILYVAPPTANPGYQTTNMLYMVTPYRLSAFALHQWIAPPAQMIQPIVMQALREKAYFKAILGAPSSSNVTYRLELQLLELQQEFFTPSSQVRLSVQATLIHNASNAVIASQRFSALLSAGPNPYSGVLAANQAIVRISDRIAAFCVAYAR